MSLANIPLIMIRIQVATEDSPIAVFKTHAGQRNKLESLFAKTIKTEARIKKDYKNLVGVFNKTMAPSKVINQLYLFLDIPREH